MKLSIEQKIVDSMPNKLINRKYRAIRKARNQSVALAGVNFGFAAADAIAHKGLMTILMGSAALFCLKTVEVGIRTTRMLRPQYLEILERAKNINKLRQQ